MRDASSSTHFTNADRFMEKAMAGRWNERRWCPVWFTTWYGPFHMGMIPFNPPWGPARVSDDVYSAASPPLFSRRAGNVTPFLRATPWKKTLISGCRRLCTLGSIHLPLHHPSVFARHNVARALVVSENSMPLFRNSSHAKLSRARIIGNRASP